MFVPIGTEEEAMPRRRFPVVTVTLVAINSAVFLLEMVLLLLGGQEALKMFIAAFGIIPAAVTSGESLLIPFFLTPLTSMFVHASLTHFGLNMIYLLAFGDNVEDRLGRGRFLLFYLLSGLVAALVQIAIDPASQVPTIGASGAIAGVLSGYILLFPKGVVRMFLFLGPLTRIKRLPALLFIGFWFVTQFFNGVGSLGVATAETGGVAYWAHIGGFAAGLGLAWISKLFLLPQAPPQEG
jgi:membrane associated rhomboid family serine protease